MSVGKRIGPGSSDDMSSTGRFSFLVTALLAIAPTSCKSDPLPGPAIKPANDVRDGAAEADIGSASSETDSFEPLDCEEGEPTHLEAVRSVLKADAVGFVENVGYASRIVVRGTPCAGDPTCKKAWDAAMKTDDAASFRVPQEPNSPKRNHYVFAFGATIKRAGNLDQLVAVLAPIDDRWKAQLVGSADGKAGRCGPHAIRPVPDGYELLEGRRIHMCNPIVHETWIVKVDRAGMRSDVKLVSRDSRPGCI